MDCIKWFLSKICDCFSKTDSRQNIGYKSQQQSMGDNSIGIQAGGDIKGEIKDVKTGEKNDV